MQKIVVDEVLDIGSEYLQANLSIENVYMKPFRTLELDGILVLDHRADTLLYAEELDLKLENYNLEMLVFEIGLSRLYNAEFNHIIYKGDSISNLNQVLERIKKEGVSESGSISLTCEDVELKVDCLFTLIGEATMVLVFASYFSNLYVPLISYVVSSPEDSSR